MIKPSRLRSPGAHIGTLFAASKPEHYGFKALRPRVRPPANQVFLGRNHEEISLFDRVRAGDRNGVFRLARKDAGNSEADADRYREAEQINRRLEDARAGWR